jgi:hypothetical protein
MRPPWILRLDAVGIDDRAAIDHRHHAADRDLSLSTSASTIAAT